MTSCNVFRTPPLVLSLKPVSSTTSCQYFKNFTAWLPVRQRIIFKTAVLVFKCICGMAPTYLVDHCKLMTMNTGRCHLRSPNLGQVSIPRTRTTNCDQSFAVCGQSVWNSVLPMLRSRDISTQIFRKQLKTLILFSY